MKNNIKVSLLKLVISMPIAFFCLIGIIQFLEDNSLRNINFGMRKKINYFQESEKAQSRYFGEGGNPVLVDHNNLDNVELVGMHVGKLKYAYNQHVSQMISIQRFLPDYRHKECLKKDYYKDNTSTSVRTKASVIIAFHDESLTVILRTLHSIVKRSPSYLLQEIIIIDDASNDAKMISSLEEYINKLLPVVKLLKSKTRKGLLAARLQAASIANGEIIVFLDSHCECTKGWLEPLVDRIENNKRAVVSPVIDIIDGNTFEYLHFDHTNMSIMGFNLYLEMIWIAKYRKSASSTAPVRSPAIPNGIYAIDLDFFYTLGGYDKNMFKWDIENLSMSLKAWMCGGKIEIIPCSHVGHIFETKIHYNDININNAKLNNIRTAEVWLGKYKSYYYQTLNNQLDSFGNVDNEREIQKTLKCNNFQWYINEVYPSLYVPNDIVFKGEIQAYDRDICLDAEPKELEVVKTWNCHGFGQNQFWMLSKSGKIMMRSLCLSFNKAGLIVISCDQAYLWIYNKKKQLQLVNMPHCLELLSIGDNVISVKLEKCNDSKSQKWNFKSRPRNYNHQRSAN